MPFSIDPQTGIATNTPDLQPMGAMGAVMTLLNSQKANEIANTLQQQRQAQAQMQSEQAEQYGLAAQRAEQLRQTMADYVRQNPNASTQDLMNTALGSGASDIGSWSPLLRTVESGQAKRDVADITAGGRRDVADINQGVTGAPKPLAQAANQQAQAGLAGAKAIDIGATEPSRISENEARAAFLWAQRALALVKAQGGAASQSQGVQIWGNAIKLANQIRLRENNLAMMGDDAYQAETAAMKQAYSDLVAVAKRSGAPQPPPGYVPDASQVAGDLAGGGAAPPATGTATGLPPGAPVQRTINLPPVPGQ